MLFLFFMQWLLCFFETSPTQFQEQVIDSNISIGYGIALGDVDGDGKPDILLADKKQFVWYRNGDWKRFVMIEDLTAYDNVCIAARDINGDGKVEVAVGAQWNPSETGNAKQSGSVHYLVRPENPAELWKAVELYHEPTVHRMQWVKAANGKYYLVVLPLHGQGNKGGEGMGVNVLAYQFPENVYGKWPTMVLDNSMHLTHNFDVQEYGDGKKSGLYIAGKEGVRFMGSEFSGRAQKIPGLDFGAGEVKVGALSKDRNFIATIEPMHGTAVVAYLLEANGAKRVVLDDNVKEGHALGVADFLGVGSDQVVAGWRAPDSEGKVGVKMYVKKDAEGKQWESYWVDENGMACENLQVLDMNGDGKPDIVASGRATKNVKIYWNTSGR